MADKTWGNPHLQQPKICATNSTTWTDPVLVGGPTSGIKLEHIQELRNAVDAEIVRRRLDPVTWADTLVRNTFAIKGSHVTELRGNIENVLKKGSCPADTTYCPQDTTGSFAYTDPTLTTNVTNPKAVHIVEMRNRMVALKTSCICEAEFCNYCADCGYSYQACSFAACCNEHQQGTYNNCTPNNRYNVYVCGSINLPVVTTYPYKAFSTGGVPTAWDGTVPWAMCNYAPPGQTWGGCTYATGQNHTAWDCKCNPFTWS